jgi:hypothetical protein
MDVKQFPLETGVPGVDMEFSWNSYQAGYGTPRHKHTFDQWRFALEGDCERSRTVISNPAIAAIIPRGVSYGPQRQTAYSAGFGLQFMGPRCPRSLKRFTAGHPARTFRDLYPRALRNVTAGDVRSKIAGI